ncbi:MAG: nucleotidyltransferase domain-containing protein [Deltaproteobacteria bacterium]|nr:nucleotidyltransferase domain-containing protein [Deltaproteobacteria bacterium]
MNNLRKIINQEFKNFPEIEIVILFGSASKGQLTQKSDVDIAVAAKKKISQEKKTDIYLALEKSLARDIDLIDLHEVNGHILKNALCQGEIIIKKSIPLLAFFLKKMWYNQEDMMPKTRMILEKQVRRFINGQADHIK